MYTWEIQQLMEYKEYVLTVKEYIDMLYSSPQINRCKYTVWGDMYELWTDDNYNVRFRVVPDEKRLTK